MQTTMEKPKVAAVRRNEKGVITHYKLSDGRELSKRQAVSLAKKRGIEGVNVGRTRGNNGGVEILRSNPTNRDEELLRNKPSF